AVVRRCSDSACGRRARTVEGKERAARPGQLEVEFRLPGDRWRYPVIQAERDLACMRREDGLRAAEAQAGSGRELVGDYSALVDPGVPHQWLAPIPIIAQLGAKVR